MPRRRRDGPTRVVSVVRRSSQRRRSRGQAVPWWIVCTEGSCSIDPYENRWRCERAAGGASTAPAPLLIPRRAKVFDVARRRPETNENLNSVAQHRSRREPASCFPERNGCIRAAQPARHQHHLFAGVLLAQATESFAEAERTTIRSIAVHEFTSTTCRWEMPPRRPPPIARVRSAADCAGAWST
jgi:hypothetical protein